MIKKVWVVTAWFADYEELNYTSPSEDFFADTYREAEQLKEKLLEDPLYEDVTIGDDPEERDFW